MDLHKLREDIRDSFIDVGTDAPATLKELQQAQLEGGERVVTQEDLRAVCEDLCDEGMLERRGKDAYGLTFAFQLQMEQDWREAIAGMVAEQAIKRAASK